jgi:hypothetical protein
MNWLSPLAWVKASAVSLMRDPTSVVGAVLAYVVALTALGMLPVVGLVAASLCMPYGIMLIFTASQSAATRQPMRWGVVRDWLADPFVRKNFALIGLFYCVVIFLTNLEYAVFAQDSVAQWATTEDDRLVFSSVLEHMPWTAVALALVTFFAGQMALFFAPMLIAIKRLNFTKALFFSFFACLKRAPLFLILGAIWLLTCVGMGLAIAWISEALSLESASGYLLVPVGIAVLCVLYGTIYPIWQDFFGALRQDRP